MCDVDHPGRPISFPDLSHPDHGPAGAIADHTPIPPHQTAIGWVNFVAPIWTNARIRAPGSDLEFFRPSGNPDTYTGEIRLWDPHDAQPNTTTPTTAA
jgi:hypothetical protein